MPLEETGYPRGHIVSNVPWLCFTMANNTDSPDAVMKANLGTSSHNVKRNTVFSASPTNGSSTFSRITPVCFGSNADAYFDSLLADASIGDPELSIWRSALSDRMGESHTMRVMCLRS